MRRGSRLSRRRRGEEERRRGGEEERRGGEEQATDIKSNNPHLAGGEKRSGDKWLNHLFTVLFVLGGRCFIHLFLGVHQPESVFKKRPRTRCRSLRWLSCGNRRLQGHWHLPRRMGCGWHVDGMMKPPVPVPIWLVVWNIFAFHILGIMNNHPN